MATATPTDVKASMNAIIDEINVQLPGRSKKELLEILLMYIVKREVAAQANVVAFRAALLAAATQYDAYGDQLVETMKNFQTPVL